MISSVNPGARQRACCHAHDESSPLTLRAAQPQLLRGVDVAVVQREAAVAVLSWWRRLGVLQLARHGVDLHGAAARRHGGDARQAKGRSREKTRDEVAARDGRAAAGTTSRERRVDV